MKAARSKWGRIAGACTAAALIGLGSTAAPVSAAPSSNQLNQIGNQLQGAQAKAAQIAAQLQAANDRLDALAQQYESAQQQVQSLDQQAVQTGIEIAATEADVNSKETNLRQQALAAYTNDDSSQAMNQLFAPGGQKTSLEHAYQQVASANVTNTIDQLHGAETALARQESQLQATEAQARANAATLASAQSQAQSVTEAAQSALSQAKGQVATLLAQRQAAQQEAEAAAFQARLAAARASGPVDANAPVSPGAAGAVQAAESQVGVPYVWGGEEPGVGFDCSGLTQWAWGRAGVSIPRTAQEQYDAIVHVPLSALQPGDLVFWDDGTDSVQHVAMYVGNGQVVQAPHTGTDVSYSAIWEDGLVGAGRP